VKGNVEDKDAFMKALRNPDGARRARCVRLDEYGNR